MPLYLVGLLVRYRLLYVSREENGTILLSVIPQNPKIGLIKAIVRNSTYVSFLELPVILNDLHP